MSRDVVQAFRDAAYPQETGEAFIVLLTFEHEELVPALRLCNNQVNIDSRVGQGGGTFIAHPFELSLPDDSEDRSPQAKLRICNVDRLITAALESILTPVTVLMELVRALQPDTVDAAFDGFMIWEATYDAVTIEGTLSLDEDMNERYPQDIFSPANFPGLF